MMDAGQPSSPSASLARRCAAELIDLALVLVAACIAAAAINLAAPQNAKAFADQQRYNGPLVGGMAAWLAFLTLAAPLNWIYRVVMKSSRSGTTFGRRWLVRHD